MDNQHKVKIAARNISFLMEHQCVVPELKELTDQLYTSMTDPEDIDRDSPEYILGAYEALTSLLEALKQKGT